MKTYLVGGAVRDALLGFTPHEHDYVVVGATPEQMLQAGYTQVGKDFPVFLHPETKDEYALARTERKSGKGYYGFECHFASDVTLEEDLMRRDLTINAMAQDDQQALIDPFGGLQDLKDKTLRHVSDAFVEDPVRVLRVARFMARFAPLGFSIHPSTLDLMHQMVEAKELEHLVPERVWAETLKALKSDDPKAFIQSLRSCGALRVIYPEMDRLYGVPQKKEYHPEIDTGIHVEMVLDQAVLLSKDPCVRFAALVHDLGKGTTRKEEWPAHIAHEERGVKIIQSLCKRIKIPNDYRDLGVITSRFHLHVHRAFELKAATVVKLFEQTDAFRKPERFSKMLVACEADARGRLGSEQKPYPQALWLKKALEAATHVDTSAVTSSLKDGKQIKEAIKSLRIQAVKQCTKGSESV